MDKQEYREYLQSQEWHERRLELMEEADWECDECGGKATQLHHLKYDNIGDEELDVDVVPLCKDCHKEVHENDEEEYDEY